MRWTNPCATLQDMGDHFGVTKERIRQVLNELDLPTRHYSEKKMVGCMKCGNSFLAKKGKEFCSIKCRQDYNSVMVSCNQCGKMVKKRVSDIVLTENRLKIGYKGNSFCDKKCQGFWLAEKHGYGVGGEVTMSCSQCNKEFHIPMGIYKSRSKKGQDLFCSRDCHRQYVRNRRMLRKKSEEGICGFCGKKFQSYGLIKRMDKSKCGKLFCSVQCGNQYKRVEKENRLKLGEA